MRHTGSALAVRQFRDDARQMRKTSSSSCLRGGIGCAGHGRDKDTGNASLPGWFVCGCSDVYQLAVSSLRGPPLATSNEA